jgi:hypothetical protein
MQPRSVRHGWACQLLPAVCPRKVAGLDVFGHVMTAVTNGTPSPASIVNVGDVLIDGDNAC